MGSVRPPASDVPVNSEIVVQHQVNEDVGPICEHPPLRRERVVGEEGVVD